MPSDLRLTAGFVCLMAAVPLTSCGGSSTPIVNPNPSQPEAEYYYAAGPVDVSAYSVDLVSGKLKKIQTLSTKSNQTTFGNAFVVTAPAKFLYMSTPVNDGINAYSVANDGTLTLVPGSPFTPGGYSSPAYTIIPGGITPSGTNLYAIDAFNLVLLHFQVNAATGALTYASQNFPGFNPGGLAIDPSGTYLYVPADIADLSSPTSDGGVLAFQIDASGNLAPLPGSPFPLPANSEPSGVRIDPTGAFLYVSLFNQGQIVAFRRDKTSGALTEISGSPFATSTVSFPETNSMAMTPSGQFLYAFDLNGNTIAGFAVDSATGALTEVPGSPFKGQAPINPAIYVTQGPITVDAFGRHLYVLCSGPQIAAYDINPRTGALSKSSGSPWDQSENIVGQIVVQAP